MSRKEGRDEKQTLPLSAAVARAAAIAASVLLAVRPPLPRAPRCARLHEGREVPDRVHAVHEKVLVNGRFSHQADILNSIAVRVTDVEGGRGPAHGRLPDLRAGLGLQRQLRVGGRLRLRVLARRAGRLRHRGPVLHARGAGRAAFPEESPSRWATPGRPRAGRCTTSARASASRTRSRSPSSSPTPTSATRCGAAIDCAVIGISYTVFQKVSAVPRTTRTYPVRIAGTSSQTLWWDTAARARARVHGDVRLPLHPRHGRRGGVRRRGFRGADRGEAARPGEGHGRDRRRARPPEARGRLGADGPARRDDHPRQRATSSRTPTRCCPRSRRSCAASPVS